MNFVYIDKKTISALEQDFIMCGKGTRLDRTMKAESWWSPRFPD